jgi:hypothetical protein
MTAVSPVGARIAASRLGISIEEYLEHRRRGERHCSGCRIWHLEGDFLPGENYCRESRARYNRAYYATHPDRRRSKR